MTGEVGGSTAGKELVTDPTKVDFQRHCQALWDREIRAEFIFHHQLLLCKGCLCCYHHGDKSSTHPMVNSVSIRKYCHENNISNGDDFFRVLWSEAVRLIQVHGKIVMPKMAAFHTEPVSGDSSIGLDVTEWYKSRIRLLEQELLTQQSENKKLEVRNKQLENQVTEVIERNLLDGIQFQRIKLHALKHLERLEDLLHPEGANCAGEHEEETLERHK